jgi:ABC-type multidrug transport system permease subunit
MVLDQARAANRATWRDGGSVFFAIVMPVALYAFMVATQGSDLVLDGVPFPVLFAASMIVWGAGVTVFMNVPEAVVTARDHGVLKRLRGTPLRPWQYLTGRTAAGLWLALVITVLVLGVATAYGVRLSAAAVLVGLLVIVVGTLTLAACGYALAAAVPDAKAVGAVGLIVMLVLAFFSDVFVNDAPDWMQTIGALFPLRHFQNALVQAWQPGGPTVGWAHLAVLVAWGLAAGAAAVRFFRWEARPA